MGLEVRVREGGGWRLQRRGPGVTEDGTESYRGGGGRLQRMGLGLQRMRLVLQRRWIGSTEKGAGGHRGVS